MSNTDPQGALELCTQIARVFDHYLVERPAWIRAWTVGAELTHWQAMLWRALCHAEPMHWIEAVDQFFQRLKTDRGAREQLPRSVNFFALSSLSGAYFDFIERLGRFTDLFIYLLNPSQEYWGEIESPRAIARQRMSGFQTKNYRESGNRLLASLGRGEQAAIDRLIELEVSWEDAFVGAPLSSSPASILSGIQRDIHLLCEPSPDRKHHWVGSDQSVQIHACHSPLREVEVLHDRLLDLFAKDPTLTPADVVVFVPNPSAYFHHLDAVFAALPKERRIPFHLSEGRDLGASFKAFLSLLELAESRFEASRIGVLLECLPLQRRFGFSGADVVQITHWIRAVGIRWGMDDATRREYGFSEPGFHTWHSGIERLLLGLTVSVDSHEMLWGMAPFPELDISDGDRLGRFITFVEALQELCQRLQRLQPLLTWVGECEAILERFFLFHFDEREELDRLRNEIVELRNQANLSGHEAKLPLSLPRETLRLALSRPLSRLRSGNEVTVSPLRAAAVLPAKVICLLGLNDQDFPRKERRPSFDLIVAHPQRTDRFAREEDRYTFLTCLLSAREVFYASYTGFDRQGQTPKPPSVVLVEFADYVRAHCQTEGATPVEHRLTVVHRLHPFSHRYFIPEGHAAQTEGTSSPLFSYATPLAEGLKAPRRLDFPPFAPIPLPITLSNKISTEDFLAFFAHPGRYFLRRSLGVAFPRTTEILVDEESFVPDGLGHYRLRDRLVSDLLASPPSLLATNFDNLRRRAQAEDELPLGAVGEAVFAEELARALAFQSKVRASYQERAFVDHSILVDFEGFSIEGRLRRLDGGGVNLHRSGRIRARDQLDLWIRHLLLLVAEHQRSPLVSEYCGWAESCRFAEVAEAPKYLRALIAYYRQGQLSPLALFPETGLAYAEAKKTSFDPSHWLDKAQVVWVGSQYREGEGRDEENTLIYGENFSLDNEFVTVTEHVFEPLVRHRELDKD